MRRALSFVATFVLPLAAAVATLAWLPPSSLEGAMGPLAWLGRASVEEPLLLGIGLYLLFAAVARHWLPRARLEAESGGGAGSRVFVAGAVALVALVWLVRASVVEVHRVVGASMAPTLNTGDRLIVDKRAYGLRVPFSGRVLGARPPSRGDVVVFAAAGGGGPDARVKRVIGLPGDVVAFDDEMGPTINGWTVPSCDVGPFLLVSNGTPLRARLVVEVLEGRSYLALRSPQEAPRAPFRVPSGKVFVLGDDRPSSDDSRGVLGAVALDALRGRVRRLAFAAARDGRLDLLRPFTLLGPVLRAGHVDVSKLEARIAACLAHPPATSTPPAAPAGA